MSLKKRRRGPVIIEDLFAEDVIMSAVDIVRRKKACSGFDTISGPELPSYWQQNGDYIKSLILRCIYRPQPVVTLKIPKPGSKEKRTLEIPSIQDRMLLCALNIILTRYYEPRFLPSSYGFRAGLSCHDALHACTQELNLGTTYIIDLDIRHCFDKVNHEILFGILRRDIKDKRLLRLLERYVNIDILNGGHIYRKKVGLSQGSAISPLLANIYLHELDVYLQKLHAHAVRYADDMLVFCRSARQAEDFLGKIEIFLKEHLKLSLNKEKTAIVRPWELHFLGHAFRKNRSNGIHYMLSLDDKAKARMLKRMARWTTAYPPPSSYTLYWDRIGAFNRGWVNYYRYVDPGIMIRFLFEAGQRQVSSIYNRLLTSGQDTASLIVCALFDCKNFSTLTDWYQKRCLGDSELLQRRIDAIMANKYSFWRSGDYYNNRTGLANKWSAVCSLPFYYTLSSSSVCIDSEYHFPQNAMPDLTQTDLLILGILAAGKNMTSMQLYSYMLMKSVTVTSDQLTRRLEWMVQEGLLLKVILTPGSRRWFHYQEEFVPEETLISYRPFVRSIPSLKKISAPIDFQVRHNKTYESAHQAFSFHFGTILFNQIILYFLLSCSGFHWFEIENTYNTKEHGKINVPLYIAASQSCFFFWTLDSENPLLVKKAVEHWIFFQQTRRKCRLVLVAASDIIYRSTLGYLTENIYPVNPRLLNDICLSRAVDWFDPNPVRPGILPISSAVSGDRVRQSQNPKDPLTTQIV